MSWPSKKDKRHSKHGLAARHLPLLSLGCAIQVCQCHVPPTLSDPTLCKITISTPDHRDGLQADLVVVAQEQKVHFPFLVGRRVWRGGAVQDGAAVPQAHHIFFWEPQAGGRASLQGGK